MGGLGRTRPGTNPSGTLLGGLEMWAPSDLAGAQGHPEPGWTTTALESPPPEPAPPAERRLQSPHGPAWAGIHTGSTGSFTITALGGSCVCLTRPLGGDTDGELCASLEGLRRPLTCTHAHTHIHTHTYASICTHIHSHSHMLTGGSVDRAHQLKFIKEFHSQGPSYSSGMIPNVTICSYLFGGFFLFLSRIFF